MQQWTNNQIHNILAESAKKFRAAPRTEYLSSLAKEIETRRISHSSLSKIMRIACETLSVFPSLAEILKIREEESLDKPAKNPVIVFEPLEPLVSPWPRFLEYLMLMIRDGKTSEGFDYACRFNKVSEEEAWTLFQLFSERKFADPFALKIIKRTDGRAFNKLFFETMGART